MQMTVEERFLEKVRKVTNRCWLWTGGKGKRKDGLMSGRFWMDGKLWMASRASWELHYGPIPDGLCVCHHCDNPLCVRPDHLFLGTQKDNMQDASRKGRIVSNGRPRTVTHCKRGHAFTEENTIIQARGYKQCRPCRNMMMRKRYALTALEKREGG